MTAIIDTNHDMTPYLPALSAAGIETVIRYLSPIDPNGEKCIKPPEAHAIAGAGLRLALVCEGWGDFAHGAISAGAGERDGAWCTDYAPAVGAPAGACLYYAIDVDASADQIRKLVLPYFRSIRAGHEAVGIKYRNGVYGSGSVCAAVLAAGLADLSWLSCAMSWTGSRAFLAANNWVLRQHVPATLCGIDCDADEANGDFGAFAAFAASQPTAAA